MSTRSRPILLVVHHEIQLVRQLAKMTSELAEVISVSDSVRAADYVRLNRPFTAVLVGKPIDSVSPIAILSNIRAQCPQVRTMVLVDPSDLGASIEALHSG